MNSMKRSLMVLSLSAAMLFAVPFPAYAANPDSEIELSVIIPEQHTVTMETDGNGIIEVMGSDQEGNTAKVDRHASQSYKITPDHGYVIDKVYYNGENVTAQVKDGIFTAPEIGADSVLKVMFNEDITVYDNTEQSTNDPESDNTQTDIEPVTSETDNTEHDINESEATETNNAEPVIKKSENDISENTESDSDNSVSNTQITDASYSSTDDTSTSVTKEKSNNDTAATSAGSGKASEKKSGSSPKTGDTGNNIWLIVLVLSIAVCLLSWFAPKHRHKK